MALRPSLFERVFRPISKIGAGLAVLSFLVAGLTTPAFGQATAANGSIEGTVVDNTGAVLPGVTVTVTSIDTGATRAVVSNDGGLYRAPLLPLGAYQVVAELEGFKKFTQTGINLSAGQTAVVNVTLTVGDLTETVVVTQDAPQVDTAKLDAGRNLTENEIKNLPLVSRNPYNFALLQPGVTGFENPEFGVPRFSANGSLLRVNYQIDGNTNTEKDRAGLRLLPVSEVMVREVKVVTSGYAPEFGQTTGLVYNAITPSGTNRIKGAAAFRFRRKDFSAFPFYFVGDRNDATKPDTRVNTSTVEIGGPVVKDKLHWYFGWENTYRDLSGQSAVTITPANQALIGLAQQPGVIPREQTGKFYIAKMDYTLSSAHRLTGRTIIFRNDSPNNIGGGLTALERTTDFLDAMESTAAQLVSTLGSSTLNEFRVQYARRVQGREANELSGTGPAINISGVANIGGPIASATDAGFGFKQGIWQVIDNVTLLKGAHSFKAGLDFQFIDDTRTSALFQLYTFPSAAAYNAAKSGANPFGYTNFTALVGNPDFAMTTKGYSGFVQDDWRLASNLKLLYGVRYDVYDVPQGIADAPFSYNQKHNADKNNFGPRVGLAWTLGDRAVLRANSGIMYDQMLLAAYENSIQSNGNPQRVSVTLLPNSAGALPFPATLNNLPAGYVLPTQSISAVDPDFQVARTWQNNVQIEQGLGQNYYYSAGYTYAKGNLLPIIRNINLINPVSTLADGRPVYSTAVNAGTRMDPRFNQINVVQSIGDSKYNAMTLQFGKRLSGGIQYDFAYTLGKGTDNAPLTSALSVQGDDGVSDPSNIDRDRGPNIMDTRHTLAGSIVAMPKFSIGGIGGAILNGNQVGLMIQFNSGLPINLRSNLDLNADGVLADRPLFVDRNSIYLPARYNVDMRYSRFVPLFASVRAEVSAEFKNVLNTIQASSVNRVLTTNAAGEPLAALPGSGSDLTPTAGYEQRQFQLGFKVYFE
jgi:hypothetical protein